MEAQGRVLLLTICAAGIGGTFQFGYNLSIINAPTLHIQEFTNETWQTRTGQPLPDHLVLLVWSLIVSLYPLGGLLGALLAGPLAVTLGRKKSLLVNNVFVLAAAALFGFSRRAGSFEMIMLGRLLVGISAGVGMNVQPMYLGESAPKELRGAVAMTSAIFTAVGLVMGQVVGLRELLGGPQAWPLLLASCLVPGALQLASLPLLPESPRYLLIDCGDPAACRAALQRLRGPADLAGELAELEQERAVCRGGRARRPWELFRERALRRQVASLVVLGGAMELCGNDAMYAYASAVFSQAGIPQAKIQYAAIGTGGCELLATLLSCLAIERAGRRVLLTGGYGLMTCWGSVFTVALCLQLWHRPWLLGGRGWRKAGGPHFLVLVWGQGGVRQARELRLAAPPSLRPLPAGVTGILATELFDQMARPAAYMVCGALMWTMLFLVGLVFPFLVVGLPAPAPWGLGACLCSVRTPPPRLHPSRECEPEGGGGSPEPRGRRPSQGLCGGPRAAGGSMATASLGSLATSRRACPTSSMCLSSVSASARPCTRASSSPRPEARASWRSRRSCTDSTSQGGAEAQRGPAPRSSGPRSCSSAGTAGASPGPSSSCGAPGCAGLVLSLREMVSGASRRPVSGGCRQETNHDKLRETQGKKIQLVTPWRGAWSRKDFARN
ncbi:PREDICTED: solute carrier family 2, facilitated glucose transporter member 11 isoform X3 [Capra hircus]|uniref:solute carrier family 2, facilitated glucose transporter member 11 isoform X3 n=1 Tax=Capra hircus TaxID=9925 RepID=UPI0008469ACD|nr:PREDICTED: solute carrier family 2, facilitated glucose transporter member 11 isoform X3 [Capra hircus]